MDMPKLYLEKKKFIMIIIKKRETFNKNLQKIKIKKPKILFLKKIIFIPKIRNRILSFFLNYKTHNSINGWTVSKNISKWTIKKNLSISIYKYDLFLSPKLIIKILLLFKRKKLFLKKNDVLILSPYPHVFFHQIFEFVLKIVSLKKKFNFIYLPYFLKKILSQNPYKQLFYNLKFKYYNYNNIIEFRNAKYLDFLPHHQKNIYLKRSINILNKKIYVKTTKPKFSLISRNDSKRKLINEEELFKNLMKFNFDIYNFSKISQKEQIEICRNSKILLGYQGSNFTNIIYMQSGSNIIDIVNNYIDNPVFKIIANMKNIHYYKSFCKKSFANLSGECDINNIINIVKKII